ncbi:peptidase M16 inactive domain-containing protein [Toxoplasma gondii GAB2-2007-GAL-DOM2]|uniref:Peptidase M16 inactive domain-containing protein n=1 Tax=Toxoplasma gondii GAB2-2007-GAL-DOM2 TaxID=1130820 RepID=A0A086JWN9_TOXGO|nr:peptidase M16 inactive domain-containing protein [Toxoplasma gondii GAB2-2007-GAL-DOM2]
MALRETEDIDKPKTKKRSYRFVKLPNHLSVWLVSDPAADLASAALDINVGSYFDPPPVEGLAHFCEHMLFLGTEKFPDETEYSNFIKQHGGCTNAYTEHTHTNYHFSVAPEHLEGVSTGGSEGTGADVRHELLAFHKTWYSANIMTLVGLGKDSLDCLQGMVEKYFGTIKDKQVPVRPSRAIVDPSVPVFRRHEDLQQVVYTVPIKDQREIHFEFVLPPQIDAWRTKHSRIFYISIELTEQGASDAGLERVEDLVFLSLSLLRTSRVQEWVFEESRWLAEMGVRFADTENPLPFCVVHAKHLHRYPPE